MINTIIWTTTIIATMLFEKITRQHLISAIAYTAIAITGTYITNTPIMMTITVITIINLAYRTINAIKKTL